MEVLVVGQKYNFPVPQYDGAASDFLRRSGNRLLIALSGINDKEKKELRKSEIRGGIYARNGAILFIWQFLYKKKLIMTFDSPFDSRVIPDLQLYNVENNQTRLLIDVHIVDSSTNLICALRAVTMPNDMTLAFFSAVQDQLSSKASGEKQLQSWLNTDLKILSKETKMYCLGE